MLTLIPLGLTLIPFLLAWRAGRGWPGVLHGPAVAGVAWFLGGVLRLRRATGFVCRTPDVTISIWHAMSSR